MASYRERIDRYLESHPGATIQEARGHGHTPERPGQGQGQERFADYYERRTEAEAHVNNLKQEAYGSLPNYNADGAAETTHKMSLGELEKSLPFDSLDDFFDYYDGDVDDGSVITTRPRQSTWTGKSHHVTGAHKFVAIDGEGITLPDGSHRYVLIRIGTNPPLENPNGLHWTAIFDYLYSHFEPGKAYVGFYLGYDFTQIFRSMRENRARKLLTKDGIASRKKPQYRMPLPVESDGWQFDIMSGRRLRIRPKICNCTISLCKCKKPPWMYICDAGGFFQTSFLVAINPKKWPEPILSDDEFAEIERGKRDRDKATRIDDDMRYYNRLENDVMARLMDRVDEGLRNLGVTLSASNWYSPAQAAQAWMRGRVPDRETIDESVPGWFREAARASYFGGWFEIMMHGRIPGIVYQYDINSAYPAHAWTLPCLLHGDWSRGHGRPDDPGKYCLVKACVMTPKGSQNGHDKKYIGTMMHRNEQGRICRPTATMGWYWNHELEASIQAGCCRVTKYLEWMKYEPCSCPSPLTELKNLYQVRKKQGKDTPLGRACRLVYNCVYGKLAQNVGDPQFMNFVYASLITAGCRTQILNAIATHPKGKADVVQVATDAVYFLTPHPSLSLTEELGDWDKKEHRNMTLFKPGVYWDDEAREMIAAGEAPQFKARGVSARDMAKRLADLDAQFAKWGGKKPPRISDSFGKLKGWPEIEFKPTFAMITALQALIRNDWSLAGTLSNQPAHQRSNPGDKRQDAYYDRVNKVYRSEPLMLRSQYEIQRLGYPESQVYDSRFDKANEDNPMSDESKEKFGISPDGMIDQLMIDAFMPDRKWTKDVR